MAIRTDADTVLTYKAAALDLAAGFDLAVFPLIPKSKFPHKGSRGFKDATKDEAAICEAWKKQPYSNIGIATGQPSGVIVLDCDTEAAFDDAFQRGLPTTWIVKTSRGYQVYLRRPAWDRVPTITKDKADMGIADAEIKADGGYVVAPPSVHPDGPVYQWEVSPDEATLGDAPDWVLDILRAKLAKRTPTAQPTPPPAVNGTADAGARTLFNQCVEAVKSASKGSRNNTLNDSAYSLGGMVGAGRFDRGDAEAALLSAALACGLDEVAARKTIASGLNAGIANPLHSRPAPKLRIIQPDPDAPVPTDNDTPPDTFNYTDIGNAERLVARHGHDLRYCDPFKAWLVWDTKRWRIDETREVERRAKETIRALYAEAASVQDDALRKDIVKHAQRSESNQRIMAMIERAKSEPGIAILPEILDADPWLLNCPNATIDLRTGVERPHRREDYITKITHAAYRPGARSDLFDQVLEFASLGDREWIDGLQEAVGYSVTGNVRTVSIFIAEGPTGAGKSTIIEGAGRAIGDYGRAADVATFLVRDRRGPSEDVADLAGARLVWTSEPYAGAKFDAAQLKRLTGNDTISARQLYQKRATFTPHFKIWISSNFRPDVSADDTAFWARVRVVPFKNATNADAFKARREDFREALLNGIEHQEAILAWLVEGCQRWYSRGDLSLPSSWRAASEGYRREVDKFEEWLEERLQQANHAMAATSFARVFEDYRTITRDHITRKSDFKAKLIAKGIDVRPDLQERLMVYGHELRLSQ